MTAPERADTVRQFWIAAILSLLATLAFYFSTKATLGDLDYTAEIASALLRGDLGLLEKPPEWLNEMIPYGNKYYSAFPLGSVLSMAPVALLQKASLIHDFPARILAALIAGGLRLFLLSSSRKHSDLTIPASNRNRWLAEFSWRCFQFSERGPGATSEWAARGKSLLVSRYWEKPQLSISRWCDRRRSSLGHSSLLLLEIGPSCCSPHLSTFICFGADRTKILPASHAPLE